MDTKGARRILVVLVDRANYGRMKMVMESIRTRPELELLVIRGLKNRLDSRFNAQKQFNGVNLRLRLCFKELASARSANY